MTLQEIIELIQMRLGEETVPESLIVSTVNGVLSKWAKFFPDEYLTSVTDTVLSTATSITLPSDFEKFYSFYIDEVEYLNIEPIDEDNYGEDFISAFPQYDTNTKRCMIIGDTLSFEPELESDSTYTLRYYARENGLTSLSDEPRIPSKFHLDLALYTAATIKPVDDLPYIKREIEKKVMVVHRKNSVHRTVKLWYD